MTVEVIVTNACLYQLLHHYYHQQPHPLHPPQHVGVGGALLQSACSWLITVAGLHGVFYIE